MYTSTELQLLRNADPGVKIPGIDTPAGNPLPEASLKSLSSIPASVGYFIPSQNTFYVTQAGATLSGYEFGKSTVVVLANNVTIKDCNFSGTNGYWAVQAYNSANTTITNCTFDSGGVPSPLCNWIGSAGTVTVTNNRFIDTPADGVDVTGGGVISGNYFSGSGYTSNGQHPDAIWITNSTAPLTISNNFIDWSTNPDSTFGVNDCIRITGELGPVSNLTVTGNFLVNGTTSLQAINVSGQSPLTNVSITGNYMGFGQCFAFYPGSTTGVTETGNTIFDYSNPNYSTSAWAAYQAAGLPTPILLTSTSGSTVNASSSTGPTTLYAGQYAFMLGGGHENNFVGGFGSQTMWNGSGASIFTYLSPADSTAACPDYITNFDPAKDVFDFSHVDANVTPGVQQNFTFIGTSAFTGAGAQVSYQQNAAANQTIVQATLAGDTSPDMQIVISGLVNLGSANFALTASQSKAALANAFAISDPMAAYWPLGENQYTNVQGRTYSSYTSVQNGSYLVADDLDFNASTGEIDLFNPGGGSNGSVTIARGNGLESITGSGKTDSLTFHQTELIKAGGAAPSTFAMSQGFGNETIMGFATSGANADMLQLATAAFSYLNASMTQAQQLAAMLSSATATPNGLMIADSHGDHLTLGGLTAATLAANPSAVRFV